MTDVLSPEALELLERLFYRSPVGVVVVGEKGHQLWFNELAKELLGPSAAENTLMMQLKEWQRFYSYMQEEKPFYYLMGEQGYVVSAQRFDAQANQYLLWMIPAASMEVDLMSMQRDVVQQRKLANLGRMILEMAHELNNPLAGISMGTQLIGLSLKKLRRLLNEEPPDITEALDTLDKVEQELDKISQSTSRAATLRNEVLSYSKPNQLTLRPYKTSKLLANLLKSFRSQAVFKQMKIHTDFSQQSPTILCDANKLEQILYNLINNAHEATGGKGEIWVREYVDPGRVLIEVEDNGPGIPEEVLSKIFSPFLTTKPRTGTGLGLSISQQIIQQHGGTFSVYNKPQSGACFQITFPIHQQAPVAQHS